MFQRICWAPIFVSFTTVLLGSPAWSQQDARKFEDPAVYCSDFKRQPVTVDGQKLMRFRVEEAKFLHCLPPQPKASWVVNKDAWSEQDESNWQSFVHSIGSSNCNTLDSCLVSAANPYRNEMDISATHYSDCADFPMYMRSYFAFKNNLPFSMVSAFEPNAPTDEQQEIIERKRISESENGTLEKYEQSLQDNRYSMNGNRPVRRVGIPSSNGASRDFFTVVNLIHDGISTGTYRMLSGQGDVESDFYSPAITKNSIQPGTILYKVTGHVALVYDVTSQGEIKYIDAHPDNSISRGSFNKEYGRSNPLHGGGFKNWRPFRVVSTDRVRFEYTRDEDISDYSAEQYYGNLPDSQWDWKKGKFVAAGRQVNFFDYVRIRMASGGFKMNPTFQFKKDMIELCTDLQERTRSVQTAVDNHIDSKDHPRELPLNIYGSSGEWEAYSTPSRDIRIRNRALDMIENAKDYMNKWSAKDPFFQYNGENLKKDLIKVYNEVDSSCRISYTNSQGKEIRMSLSAALGRVTRMSFDPYFCPERRWGAKSEAELRSCVERTDKAQWYAYTQFLRSEIHKDPTAVMGYSLGDVKRINEMQSKDSNESTSRFNIQRALKGL